ncbi:MAG: 2Fe-2S iron-sulfur cluster binding domain-containing protein [Phycisphaerales bacterium]|nr:2Fe-2S iron-sulfur cluster binding domain-containing protein [Phycisphaerales bacterium]
MHVKHTDSDSAQRTVSVTFHLEDPRDLTGTDQTQWQLVGAPGETLLELAGANGINIEHSCGGVCACSTCHIYVEQGADQLSEPDEDEEDRVEEAPDVRMSSRLSCQCRITGAGPIVVRVPAWNRNAVKETPH